MTKTKLVKALLLGACFSLFFTGAAYASGGGTSGSAGQDTPAFEGVTEENKELIERQNQIDQFVFNDHAKEIEEMGFVVTHTGVIGDAVEVGIAPYEKAFVDYLYENLGKEQMNIVEGEINMLLTAPDSPDAAVSSPAAGEDIDQPVAPVDETMDDEELTIQITSENQEDSNGIAESGIANNETAEEAASSDGAKDAAKVEPVSAPVEENSRIGTFAIIGAVVVILLVSITIIVRKQKAMKR